MPRNCNWLGVWIGEKLFPSKCILIKAWWHPLGNSTIWFICPWCTLEHIICVNTITPSKDILSFSIMFISFVSFTWYSVKKFQDSYRSNYHGLKDIEDIQLVLCSGLDIIHYILSNLPEVKQGRHLVMSFSLCILPNIDSLLIQFVVFFHHCEIFLQLHICHMWCVAVNLN